MFQRFCYIKINICLLFRAILGYIKIYGPRPTGPPYIFYIEQMLLG